MIKNNYLLALGLAALVILVASPVHAQNFIVNGGFETAGSTMPAEGWVPAAAGYSRSSDAFEGLFAIQLSSPTTTAAVFLQNSVEQGGQPLVVGSNPIFTFQAKGFAGTTGNVLYALRYLDQDGTILSDSGLQFFENSINPDTYTGFSFDLGVVPAGANTAFVEFSQAIGPIDDNNLAGLVLVDNISLVDPNAVPEPTTASLIGLGGIGILLRRRRQLV